MTSTTSTVRYTRHGDEYAAHVDGAYLGIVRREGAVWSASPRDERTGRYLPAGPFSTRARAGDALAYSARHAHLVAARQAAPAETETTAETLAPGMYRVRVTVTNRDGMHTATEDMNPAAIELARARPGWSVEILGESRVTIVADEEGTAEEQAPAGRVRLIGIGNVPAVPLSDVRPGDRIVWNYGQTYTVVRNTKVAASTYELVERGEDGREWTRRKRGTKLVARRPGIDQAPADRSARVIRPAHTIEQGARIVLDGNTVTVLDVDRDDTARTVTLVTSYGAPRTVTRDAAVPVLFGAAAPVDDLARFENLGREAHRNGEMRAPAMNAEVRAAIGDAPVGEPRTLAIMRAFSRGYDAAIQDELTALGF